MQLLALTASETCNFCLSTPRAPSGVLQHHRGETASAPHAMESLRTHEDVNSPALPLKVLAFIATGTTLLAAAVGLHTTAVLLPPPPPPRFLLERNLSQTAILLRHGEKEGGGDDLSPRGYARAACLAKRLGAAGIGHLFAYTDHHSRRSVETITPLSQAIGVPIDTSIGRDDVAALAKRIASLPPASTVLVCWEHKVPSTSCVPSPNPHYLSTEPVSVLTRCLRRSRRPSACGKPPSTHPRSLMLCGRSAEVR